MKSKGFTLIELLVVIAIIGLLSSVAVVSMNSSRDKARIAAGQSFERSILDVEGDAILAQWDFDDCTGTGIAATAVADLSGNGNNATPTGSPQWSSDTPSKNGCSLSLNGTSQYAAAARSFTELASNPFTVSFWAKRTSASVIGIAFSLGYSSQNNYLHMGFRASNTFMCGFYANDLDTTVTYTDANWHHWACSYDTAANKRRLYRDGVLVASDTPANAFTGTGTPEIGHYAAYFFPGDIDNVRIYTKSLTAQAVGKLYAEGRGAHADEVASNIKK